MPLATRNGKLMLVCANLHEGDETTMRRVPEEVHVPVECGDYLTRVRDLRLRAFICRVCGYTELYTHEPPPPDAAGPKDADVQQ